ncbi:MAG: acyltransferase [Proteobacteria bacterium]|nr:acyltransferase [Pseudomonadota bacterium]
MEPTVRSQYIPQLDAIRALAFTLVVVVHYSVPTWEPALLDRGFLISQVVSSIIHCGWFGVPVFLFASGYSLANGKTEPGTSINFKDFYLNRLLRLYPLYIVALAILVYCRKVPVISLIGATFLQTQDIFDGSAFTPLWSLQLESACYLLFPIFIVAITNRQRSTLKYFFAAMLMIRGFLFYLPAGQVWLLSYGTVFGGATVFLAGMIGAALPNIASRAKAWAMTLAGGMLLILLTLFVSRIGGYQTASGLHATAFWLLFPEIMSTICFLLLKGAISLSQTPAGRRKPGILHSLVVHIGRVSYSGYVFHLFVLDGYSHLGFTWQYGSLKHFAASFVLYYTLLIAFSHVTYNAIELPFLRYRRVYQKHKAA